MGGIKEFAEATLGALNRIEVRGRDSVVALAIAIVNIENIAKACSETNEEAKPHDADDRQEQDV